MRKIIAILFLIVFLVVTRVAQAAPWDKGEEVSSEHVSDAALENANEKAVFLRYEVPGSGLLRSVLKIRHEFPNGFTANVTGPQLSLLNSLGIEIEEVQLYYVTGKPVCGNGIIEGGEKCGEPELPDCPEGKVCETCKCVAPEEPGTRECYPEEQIPWGVVKVKGGTGGTGVKVAVLDTGVYKDHLDLKSRILDCKDFTKGPRPKNNCKDGYGHGTHVAGTISADGGLDGKGIFGVAPEANLMAYKVCGNDGGCWADDIAAAIDYAASHGVEVISMSFGGNIQSNLIKEAIDRNLELLYIAAAGNDGPADGSIDYPAANANVIAAGAIDSSEVVPDFSSRGINDGDYIVEEREVEFGAPGVSVESTLNNGCYAYVSGTSMATPHVSGLAAKLWQGNAVNTRSYLQGVAKDIWDIGDDTATGFGLPIAQ